MTQERGFVLPLFATVITAVATLVLVELAAAVPPPEHGKAADTEARVSELRRGALETFRRDRRMPRTLSELTSAGPIASDVGQAGDPYGPAVDLEWRTLGSTRAEVSSTGPDGRRGTTDDIVVAIDGRNAAIARTRLRLRSLRELFLGSVYVNTKTATPAQKKALRQALERAAVLRREAALSEGAARRARARAATKEEAKVATLLRAMAGPPLPREVDGPGGLLESLGLPDTLRLDAFGRTLVVTPAGFGSRGADAREGTDDDL